MAKRANTIGTVQITISTTREIQAYLEQLVLDGLHGKNPAEAADRLLSEALDALIKDGTLRKHGRANRHGGGK